MNLAVDISWLMAVLLVSIRLAVLFFATPMDGLSRLPAQVRIFLVFSLALVFVSVLDVPSMPGQITPVALSVAAINEVAVGLLMAFGLYAAFASLMIAGKLVDFQAGFGAAEILNPSSGTSSPLTGTVFSMFAILCFFLSNAHHLLLKGVAYSLQIVPPGQPLSALQLPAVLQQFGNMFIYGLIIAGPIIGVLLLLDTVIAVMGRSMPQMNVYFLFLPLKIFVALVMSAVAIRFLSPVFEKLFIQAFGYMNKVVV